MVSIEPGKKFKQLKHLKKAQNVACNKEGLSSIVIAAWSLMGQDDDEQGCPEGPVRKEGPG
jgi:hypothetical protein